MIFIFFLSSFSSKGRDVCCWSLACVGWCMYFSTRVCLSDKKSSCVRFLSLDSTIAWGSRSCLLSAVLLFSQRIYYWSFLSIFFFFLAFVFLFFCLEIQLVHTHRSSHTSVAPSSITFLPFCTHLEILSFAHFSWELLK